MEKLKVGNQPGVPYATSWEVGKSKSSLDVGCELSVTQWSIGMLDYELSSYLQEIVLGSFARYVVTFDILDVTLV